MFCPRNEKEWFPKVMIVKVQVEIRSFLIVGSDRWNLDFAQLAFGADYFVKIRGAGDTLPCRLFWHLIFDVDFNKRLGRHDPVSSDVDICTVVGFVFFERTGFLEAKIFANLKKNFFKNYNFWTKNTFIAKAISDSR